MKSERRARSMWAVKAAALNDRSKQGAPRKGSGLAPNRAIHPIRATRNGHPDDNGPCASTAIKLTSTALSSTIIEESTSASTDDREGSRGHGRCWFAIVYRILDSVS
jgi:hypothetical protein